MSDVVFQRVSKNRLNRVRELSKTTQQELYNKLDLLNTIYGIVFPDYSPEGHPLSSMPFNGNAGHDKQYSDVLVKAIKRKFEEK